MIYLLAIDPSIVSVGAALFRDGLLVANARVRVTHPDAGKMNPGMRCMLAANAVNEWLTSAEHDHAIAPNVPVHSIAYEWPQIYDHDRPSVANAVISMAGVALALTTALAARAARGCVSLQVHANVPRDIWGQLPKSKTGSYWACPRGARVRSRLSEAELAAAVDQHDAGDAVGIGLHALGRFKPRHAFSSQ